VIELDGPERRAYRALHTPGHAPGHLCFHDEAEGVIVAGDMVASVGTILIDPVEGDMGEYLAQLDRLAKLGANVALPAHGDPIDAPEALFRRYIEHRLMREAKVVAALSQPGVSPSSTEALVPIVYADTPPLIWPIARLSLEAHLLKLERDGRARRGAAGWAITA
jgi:glyoxylase-like metal-dependent hydrolase (beta-lactamase superfamily II)